MKRMRKSIVIVYFLCMAAVVAAQGQRMKYSERYQDRMEEMQSKKVAYFTEKMKLSPETAEKFWPLYNEMESKKKENHAKFRELLTKMREAVDNGKKLSDEDYTRLADAMIEVRVNQASLQSEYHQKFKEVLSPKQLMTMYKVEEQFGKEMLRSMHQKSRQQGQGQGQGQRKRK